jgi:DNA-binding Lrp family transcriptional regulator
MKGLSSMERIILECIGNQAMSYEEIQKQTGLHENVCFNLLQALLIRGILATTGAKYSVRTTLSKELMEEINGKEAKQAESLEMIEAVLERPGQKVFRFQKVALDGRDEKLFLAMLSNLESFLADAHKKSHKDICMKERKVVFWGMGELQDLMAQIVMGN